MADLTPGIVGQLSPLVRRLLAPNPGVMTGPGTNTYLVGNEQVAVIDPGPADDGHLDAVAAAGAGRIRWILVTHTHPDHAPGAAGLRTRTGAEVLGYDARDDFEPDTEIGDGWELAADGFTLAAVHTPGHASNHLCYVLGSERLLFSGDHIMNGSTVVIAPPDGDMAAYLRALERLQDLAVEGIAPGHGPFIDDPGAKVEEYLTHRRAREVAIADALAGSRRATVEELVAAVYVDVPEHLHPIARFSVWAHLRKLADEGAVRATDVDDLGATWHAVRTA
jgi:glyoxylase-like metal-dependent hydrolase (beta-lactamase superfamily II)